MGLYSTRLNVYSTYIVQIMCKVWRWTHGYAVCIDKDTIMLCANFLWTYEYADIAVTSLLFRQKSLLNKSQYIMFG